MPSSHSHAEGGKKRIYIPLQRNTSQNIGSFLLLIFNNTWESKGEMLSSDEIVLAT